jgi:hypothetical protein
VLISLYSGAACWLLLPSDQTPPAAAVALVGPLILEATIPSDVLIASVWRRMQLEMQDHGYCCISEDLALLLLDDCLKRHGALTIAPAIPGDGEDEGETPVIAAT